MVREFINGTWQDGVWIDGTWIPSTVTPSYIDSENKRRAAANVLLYATMPLADGTIDADDRKHACYLYRIYSKITTEDQRRSCPNTIIHTMMPVPDGTITVLDRKQANYLYRIGATPSTKIAIFYNHFRMMRN